MARRGYPPEFRRRVVDLVEGGRKVSEVTSSDLKDRVHLRVQVPHLCEGISKRDVPEPARNLGLTGTVSKVNREGPTVPPDFPSTIQICASVPAMSRPDDVPPVVPLVVPFNHWNSSPPKRVSGESRPKGCLAGVLTSRRFYRNTRRRSADT